MKESGVEVTFEEIVEIMDLRSDEISDLRAMLTRVVNHSEFGVNQNENDSDYSSTEIFGVAENPMGVDERIDAPDLTNVKMSDWERTVFEAWMADSSCGWASRVADQHGYSRCAPKLALDRILIRIRKNSHQMMEAA